MAWRRPGDKPLPEPMMVRLTTHICVTRPQWVKYIQRFRFRNSNSSNRTSEEYIWKYRIMTHHSRSSVCLKSPHCSNIPIKCSYILEYSPYSLCIDSLGSDEKLDMRESCTRSIVSALTHWSIGTPHCVQGSRSPVLQAKACRLFATKPLPESIVTHMQMIPMEYSPDV